MSEPLDRPSDSGPPSTPMWVKALAAAMIVIVVVAVALMIVGGGAHGPTQHGF